MLRVAFQQPTVSHYVLQLLTVTQVQIIGESDIRERTTRWHSVVNAVCVIHPESLIEDKLGREVYVCINSFDLIVLYKYSQMEMSVIK